MRSFLLAAAVLLAAPAHAVKRTSAAADTVKLMVVGYRTDGIDTSHTGAGELQTVRVADIKAVSHPSSWYYAVETGTHTFLASEISLTIGGKIARFSGDAANPPEGSAADLMSAARQQLSPQKIAKARAGVAARHRKRSR